VIFRALACDYDGTLTSDGRLSPPAVAALEAARAAGTRLILVTGRGFFDLTRVCERLDLFDLVVAENGAVLYRPGAQLLRELAPAAPPRLLAELDRRGILYEVGRVVIGVARSDEAAVRDALAATGVSLDVAYNRGRLMLLPHGVSKGAGIRRAARELGLSLHDVLALGDAENDLDLFAACGFSGCPSDAEPVIRDRADWVLPGRNGDAVAAAIAGPILGGALAVVDSPRRRVRLGWALGTAEPVTIPARDCNVLVVGDPQTGKSWLAGVLVERLADDGYAVLVLDPEGDYRALAGLPRVAWVEGRDPGSLARALVAFERDPGACVVVDLSSRPHGDKLALVETALARAGHLRRTVGLPHWIVLDEAHYFLHGTGLPDPSLLAAKGIGAVTYRPSRLGASVAGAFDALLLSRTTDAGELAFLRELLCACPDASRVVAALPTLPSGEFVLARPRGASGCTALTFEAIPRQTAHVRHRGKYADAHLSPEHRFLFRDEAGRVVATADSLRAFGEAVAAVPAPSLAHHAGRGDFSRWVRDVFADQVLGQALEKLEARWRRGELADLGRAIAAAVHWRYGAPS
jgi:hydroxymethylpyrimidine pyrophosphatase-like HAD family hydrolase